MNKEEFLRQLAAQLYTLTPEERESAVSYYREYLEEAGADERAAIEALGSPQSVAERIIREIGSNRVSYAGSPQASPSYMSYQYDAGDAASPKSSGGRLGLTILVICVSFPLWITVMALWLALVCTMGGLLAGFGFAAVAAPFQGIGEIFGGQGAVGVYDIGVGIFCLGLLLLCWKPLWLGMKYTTKGMFRLFKLCIDGLMGREKAV